MLIAASVLLPILFTVAIGVLLERKRPMDARTLSTLSIYVLTPCLVFYSLLTSHLTHRDLFQMAAFLPMLTLALWVVVKGVMRLRHDPPSEEGAMMLPSLFMNAGNYGIPMCEMAFGPAGVEHGVIWVVLQNSLLFPLATYYAARDRHGSLEAFKAVFRLPVIYAAGLAVVMRLAHVPLPVTALETVKSIGYAMIPIAQILLGVQLSKTAREAHTPDVARIRWVVFLRLVASPLLAILLVRLMGAEGLTRKVLLLLSGTPTAVNMTVLSLEFDNRPHFIAAAVFFSTVFSFLTLSVLLTYLLR